MNVGSIDTGNEHLERALKVARLVMCAHDQRVCNVQWLQHMNIKTKLPVTYATSKSELQLAKAFN